MAAPARQSPGEQFLFSEPQAPQVPGGHLPVVGGVADTESLRVGRLESPGGKELPAGAGSSGQELLRIKLCSGPVRLDQPAPPGLLLAGNLAALLVTKLDPGPGCQALNGLGEPESVDLADEGDNVATLGAGEAVPQAAGRGHMERRRLLLVERAESLERAAARSAQLQVFPDYFRDG